MGGYQYWGYFGLENIHPVALLALARSNDLLHLDKYSDPLYQWKWRTLASTVLQGRGIFLYGLYRELLMVTVTYCYGTSMMGSTSQHLMTLVPAALGYRNQ